MKRRYRILIGILLCIAARVAQGQTPNILLITADDMDYYSLGVNGSKVEDITPNLDKLAGEGIRFTNAHVTVAVCQPSRGVIGTGRYPNNSGILGFYSAYNSVPTLAEELKKGKGYEVGVLGKVKHSTPKDDYIWDYDQDAKDLGSGRSPRLYKKHFQKFVQQAKGKDAPFFMMANTHDPHRPFFKDTPNYERGGKQRPSRIYTPDEVEVPGFLEDLPGVREELAGYYSSVRRCDDVIGGLLKVLDEEGLAENTIVVYLSDNGMAFPFAKSNVYVQSTRTPFIVKWPKGIKAGQVDEEHLISMVDLMPTLLEATKIKLPKKLDGRSFLPILKGKKQQEREFVYTHYNENSGSKAFTMRAVQSKDILYIFNPWAVGGRQYKTSSINGSSFEAMTEAAQNDKELRERLDFCLFRTVTEMYDLSKDPHALKNIIDDDEYATTQEVMEQEMIRSMQVTKDPMLQLFLQRDNEQYLMKETNKIQKDANIRKKERRVQKAK
ncbi:sulfatase family protein [Flammeovirga agarivorans]|uniref:Sulfatase n=1 Tax=Flammeovirga agarivorans TaxID=2726742 RepID=A0A7X8XVW5_9BACT|nr:sulfatase [Flammeovirga agarivorans]NLR91654.1 sulfatase [Flammeovirga agarivorans]